MPISTAEGKSEESFLSHLARGTRSAQQIYLQSKCGIRFPGEPHPDSPHRFDFSYEHIIRSVEGSLARLRSDYLDVLLLTDRSPDEPEEVARAFDDLHASGKVRYFGLATIPPHRWSCC